MNLRLERVHILEILSMCLRTMPIISVLILMLIFVLPYISQSPKRIYSLLFILLIFLIHMRFQPRRSPLLVVVLTRARRRR